MFFRGIAGSLTFVAHAMLFWAGSVQAVPLGAAFTYQGQLKQEGVPLTGSVDLQFTLSDAPTGGTASGTQVLTGVGVSNGLFTVTLNAGGEFGSSAFKGDARWLEIAVRNPSGSGGFTVLGPRQPVTATPYAVHALEAARCSDPLWERNGENIRNLNAGQVGIGTTTPEALLDVAGTLRFGGFDSASLPAPGAAGRLVRMSDGVRGLWIDEGTQWFSLSGEVVNVKEFGAKGNGVHDDSQAFKDAVSVLHAGGQLWLPPGTYAISQSIVPPSNVTIAGAGDTSVVVSACLAPSNFNFFDVTGRSRITFQGLRLNGKGKHEEGWRERGIFGMGSETNDIRVLNCTFENLNVGIHLGRDTVGGGSVNNPVVAFCRFTNLIGVEGGSGYGLSYDAVGGLVLGNYFQSCERHAYYFGSNGETTSSRLCRGVGNILIDCGLVARQAGIAIRGTASAPAEANIISSDTLINSEGISLDEALACEIGPVTIREAAGAGVVLSGASSHNRIHHMSFSGTGSGIRIVSTGDANSISDCDIAAGEEAIFIAPFQPGGTGDSNGLIANNRLQGRRGVHLVDASGWVISDNYASNCMLGGYYSGSEGGPGANHNSWVGNTAMSCSLAGEGAVYAFTLGGDGAVVERNVVRGDDQGRSRGIATSGKDTILRQNAVINVSTAVTPPSYCPNGFAYCPTTGSATRVQADNESDNRAILEITSADHLDIYGYDRGLYKVTGSNDISIINLLDSASMNIMRPGMRLTLVFDSNLVVRDGAGNLELAGNFSAAPNAVLALLWDGSRWLETSRSSN